jgi:hypothetical protein
MIELWVKLSLLIELDQKDKEESGKYSGKDWTGRIERSLIKCSLIQDCVNLQVVMLAGLYGFIRSLCLLYSPL